MIIRVQCQHCQSEFETEGQEQTTFCPSCYKETFILPKRPVFTSTDTDGYSNTTFWGYFCAFLIPFVGFFIGVYLMTKKQQGNGVTIMALSIFAGLIWLILFNSINIF